MFKQYYFFLLLFILQLPAISAHAQREQLFFKNFSVDQGLPSNEVYRILEDTSGYLWITTDRGIVRYDGYSFEEIPVEGISEVYPWFGIIQDVAGKIYFIGYRGYVAVYENGKLNAYKYNDKAMQLGSGELTASGFAARSDSLWFSYASKGTYLITPKGDVIKQDIPPGIHFNLYDNTYQIIWGKELPSGQTPFYIKWENGFSSKDSIAQPLDKGTGILHYEKVGDQELFCIGRQILFFKNKQKQGRFVFPRNVYSFNAIDDHHVLIGFSNGGVALYELGNASLKGPLQIWLPGLSVTKILRDQQGGIWFATRENGLFYANPTRAMYREGQSPILFVEGDGEKAVVGYQSGLVQVFAKDKLQHEVYVPISKDERINEYNITATGDIVANTTMATYVSDKDGKFHLALDSVKFLLPAIGYGGYNATQRQYIYDKLQAITDKYNILLRRITSTHLDITGRMWVGTFEGLYIYEGDKLVRMADKDPLFANRIVALKKMPGNWLAIATLGSGLILYKDGEIHVLNNKNGLITPIINDIEVDGDTIWLATNKGLSKAVFNDKKFYVWNYGGSYGLPTLDIHMLSIQKGWIYFKWVNRLVMVEKDRLQSLPPSGIPHITSVTVDGALKDIAAYGVFKYFQNAVQINFNSISFANGLNQEYRYQLKGLDDKVYTTKERRATFTNLSPGNYTFSVQAADAQGNFLPHIATYSFTIKPAFWQQWWFPAAVGVILLLIALFFFRLRLKTVKKKNQMMLDLAENQQKALVQLISPHFIFNVLNTAQAAILKEDKMSAASIISRFAKLMRLSLELSRERFVLLEQEIELLKRYADLEMTRTPGKFTYDTKVCSDIDVTSIRIPSMLIQPFVENAIKHGIMHLIDKVGHIQLTFERDGELLLCKVEDNGIGREQAAAINASRLPKHHSVGIDITRRRLRLLHHEKNTEYRYFVEDRYNEDGAPAGTTVIFSIPFNN